MQEAAACAVFSSGAFFRGSRRPGAPSVSIVPTHRFWRPWPGKHASSPNIAESHSGPAPFLTHHGLGDLCVAFLEFGQRIAAPVRARRSGMRQISSDCVGGRSAGELRSYSRSESGHPLPGSQPSSLRGDAEPIADIRFEPGRSPALSERWRERAPEDRQIP